MTYNKFTHEQDIRFRNIANKHQLDVNRSDIYVDVVQDFYNKYDLPALWLDESGFSIGDADNEDFDSIFDRIKELHFDDFSNEISNMDRDEVDNDDILLFLDMQLMKMEEEAYDKVLSKYE